MKIFKKIALAIVFATVSMGATFAAEGEGLGKYAKLTLGYSRGGVDTEWDFDSYKINYAIAYSGFEIIPTFGLEIPVSAFEKKNLSLALEGGKL